MIVDSGCVFLAIWLYFKHPASILNKSHKVFVLGAYCLDSVGNNQHDVAQTTAGIQTHAAPALDSGPVTGRATGRNEGSKIIPHSRCFQSFRQTSGRVWNPVRHPLYNCQFWVSSSKGLHVPMFAVSLWGDMCRVLISGSDEIVRVKSPWLLNVLTFPGKCSSSRMFLPCFRPMLNVATHGTLSSRSIISYLQNSFLVGFDMSPNVHFILTFWGKIANHAMHPQ